MEQLAEDAYVRHCSFVWLLLGNAKGSQQVVQQLLRVHAASLEQHDEWAVGRRYMTMVTLLSPPGREVTSGKEVLLQAAG